MQKQQKNAKSFKHTYKEMQITYTHTKIIFTHLRNTLNHKNHNKYKSNPLYTYANLKTKKRIMQKQKDYNE